MRFAYPPYRVLFSLLNGIVRFPSAMAIECVRETGRTPASRDMIHIDAALREVPVYTLSLRDCPAGFRIEPPQEIRSSVLTREMNDVSEAFPVLQHRLRA